MEELDERIQLAQRYMKGERERERYLYFSVVKGMRYGGLGPDHVATKSLPPLLQAHGPLPLRRCARDRMVIALQTFTALERR